MPSADSCNRDAPASGSQVDSAGCVVSRMQAWRAAALLVASAVFLLWDYKVALTAIQLGLCGFYAAAVAFRLGAFAAGIGGGRSPSGPSASTDAEALPTYTVLAPLYREAGIVGSLLASLANLDYPASRLDVKLLVEEEDAETRAALARHALPVGFEIVVVPDGRPRTKPRACNVGLATAKGELLVIFDAEDRPEADQLRKAAEAFALAPPTTVCLQARLLFHNLERNLLTRLFALEYLLWYRYALPGMVRLKAPIPLGGTSNHFRTAALREIGGWDAYNVTEDCDLGMRIARAGLGVGMLDSTTWEEANCRLGNWIRQRSRWVKGYAQTHLVHTRHWGALLADLGGWRTGAFLLTVGGQVLMQLLNPVYWTLMGAWLVFRWPLVYFDYADDYAGGFAAWSVASWALFGMGVALLGANLLLVAVHLAACLPRERRPMLRALPLLPGYWVLMSIGAWKGAGQLLTRPFHWEKTRHGL